MLTIRHVLDWNERMHIERSRQHHALEAQMEEEQWQTVEQQERDRENANQVPGGNEENDVSGNVRSQEDKSEEEQAVRARRGLP